MPRPFYNRELELRTLERTWSAREGQLVLVWGRRRTGKSYLLAQFAEGKRAVHYTATERSPDAELAAFSDAVRVALDPGPRDLLAGGPFRSWDEALRYLAAAADGRRLLVVLDELQYLVAGDPALPSVIQRFWDEHGRGSRLRLVLCGSATAVLEGLGAERAPLFGRFSTSLQIHPFSYHETAVFQPGLAPADQAVMYGILGGMPLYLGMWNAEESVADNALRLFGDPGSPLVNEGELLLRTELPEAAGYFRLMSAVAAGRTRFAELRDTVQMNPARPLERLTSVRLLERRAPVTEDPARSRQRAYRVADNFLAFWFRFVYPNRGEIERGLGPAIVRAGILPLLDDYMGPVFEEMCRDYVRLRAAAGELDAVTRVGAWWTRDGQTEIDVVALSRRSVVLAGEAKWARSVDRRVLRDLTGKLPRLPNVTDDVKLALFARERFHDLTSSDALLVTARDLYAVSV